MFTTAVIVFILLHGLVHVWYFLLSSQLVTYKSDMGWNAQSKLLFSWSEKERRLVASMLYLYVTILFILAVVGYWVQSLWWSDTLMMACISSSVVILLFFDGTFKKLVQKGLIGLILNIVILIYVMSIC
jgi:hypothetical protein